MNLLRLYFLGVVLLIGFYILKIAGVSVLGFLYGVLALFSIFSGRTALGHTKFLIINGRYFPLFWAFSLILDIIAFSLETDDLTP